MKNHRGRNKSRNRVMKDPHALSPAEGSAACRNGGSLERRDRVGSSGRFVAASWIFRTDSFGRWTRVIVRVFTAVLVPSESSPRRA